MTGGPRILHVIHSGAIGGGPEVVLQLCRRIPAHHTVAAADDGPLLSDARAAGAATVPLRHAGEFSFAASIPVLAGQSSQADIVHLHGQFAGMYGAMSAAIARTPVVYTTQFPSFLTDRTAINRARNWVAEAVPGRLATCVVAVSEWCRHEYIRRKLVSPRRIRTIYNCGSERSAASDPIQTRRALGIRHDEYVIIAVGRLTDQKGFDVLLEAAPHVVRAVPGARFVIVGDGPERSALESQVARLGMATRVSFTGFRRDVTSLLGAADVMAAPSRFEAFPLTVLEAMTAARPVVVSDLPTLREAVVPGETGLIVPLQAGALACALVDLLRNSQLRAAMGDAGRIRAETLFSPARMARCYEQLYASVVASR